MRGEYTEKKYAELMKRNLLNSNYGIDPIAHYGRIYIGECYNLPKIKKVIFNDPATIILWYDGTKTVVKCDSEDEFDKEKGILYAAIKKLSTKKTYNDILRVIDSIQDPFVDGAIFCEEKKEVK